MTYKSQIIAGTTKQCQWCSTSTAGFVAQRSCDKNYSVCVSGSGG